MLRLTVRVVGLLSVAGVLMANGADAANLIARFSMEEAAAPLVDTVSGLLAEERAGGHVYSEPGPTGFGNAVGLSELGAWTLSVDDSAELRDLENDFTVAAWVFVDSVVGIDKPADGTGGVNRIMGDADNWDADGWAWGIHNDGRVLFTKNGIIDAWSLPGIVELDEWTHVAVTVGFDDGITYYVNGNEEDNVPSFDDLNLSPGNNGVDDFWGIGQANTPTNEQWFAGLLDEVRVYSDLLTPEEIKSLLVPDPTTAALEAGDADMDLDFDQLDLVKVQVAAKYLTGQAATWGEGDWDGAPGGEVGNPPAGNGSFDQLDIISALAAGTYLTGPYAALTGPGDEGDEHTSLVYDAATGELKIDSPDGADLTSINIVSAGSRFIGDKPAVLDGAFDNFAADNIFKATFGGSFGDISFGSALPAGLSEADVMSDLAAVGSLAGGGDLGNVDLVYIPEPSSVVLMSLAAFILIASHRRR